MLTHKKILMYKNAEYRVDEKAFTLYKARNLHKVVDHDDVVINLMGGERVWTMIQFKCGERIKINCSRLTKL